MYGYIFLFFFLPARDGEVKYNNVVSGLQTCTILDDNHHSDWGCEKRSQDPEGSYWTSKSREVLWCLWGWLQCVYSYGVSFPTILKLFFLKRKEKIYSPICEISFSSYCLGAHGFMLWCFTPNWDQMPCCICAYHSHLCRLCEGGELLDRILSR